MKKIKKIKFIFFSLFHINCTHSVAILSAETTLELCPTVCLVHTRDAFLDRTSSSSRGCLEAIGTTPLMPDVLWG